VSFFKGQEELNLTEGGIVKPLLFLSLPIVVTNLMQTAYNLADTFWLGQYSTEALAAISFAFPMVFLLISLGMGLSVAGSVLVAQHTGADETEQAEYAASQTVSFAFIASAILGAVGYPFIRQFLSFLGASADVLQEPPPTCRWSRLGFLYVRLFRVHLADARRGRHHYADARHVRDGRHQRDSRPIPDQRLVGRPARVPRTRHSGGGCRHCLLRGLAMLVGLYIMLSGTRGIQINLADMKPDLQYLRKILRIGVPASIEGTGRALSINALLIVVGLFSTSVVAAFGIGTRVFSVIFLPRSPSRAVLKR